MGRPQDPTIRPRLLEQIQDAIQGSTLSSVTFRGLAAELGLDALLRASEVDPRTIDALVAEAVRRSLERAA